MYIRCLGDLKYLIENYAFEISEVDNAYTLIILLI